MLVTAKPPAVPPVRPMSRAAVQVAPSAESFAVQAAAPPAVPPARPGAAAANPAAPDAQAEGEVVLAALPADAPVSFDGVRPAARPTGSAPPAPVALAGFDGPRPALRPSSSAPIAAPEPDLDIAAEPESAPDVDATLAAIVAGAADPLAGATSAAVPRAVRPDSRPQNFATVVSRARDRVARTQPAAPSGGSRQEEADSEPEVASAAAARPSGPTPGGVAGAATAQDAINLRDVNLIGVYGRPTDRRALIRLSNGRYVRVSVGDRFEGGQVTAIGDDALNYVVRGRTYLLQIPGD